MIFFAWRRCGAEQRYRDSKDPHKTRTLVRSFEKQPFHFRTPVHNYCYLDWSQCKESCRTHEAVVVVVVFRRLRLLNITFRLLPGCATRVRLHDALTSLMKVALVALARICRLSARLRDTAKLDCILMYLERCALERGAGRRGSTRRSGRFGRLRATLALVALGAVVVHFPATHADVLHALN